ncbi:EpsG family protein [Hydrogenothermus marinus]|uniref:EpsG-like putative glucosyltransferase n=1 Tax=Hydrogenothermus marinus TaxID=133270 RepID=A0A3M0BFC8_9AQUI|nr:EpsG family protein [Hydrogenothermus marinus]RMA93305.1 EpsG-like putative glucosyltransferase [Hydrogenothermus marinus]
MNIFMFEKGTIVALITFLECLIILFYKYVIELLSYKYLIPEDNSFFKKTRFNFNIVFLTFTTLSILILVALRPINAGNDTPRYIQTYEKITTITSAPLTGYEGFGSREIGFWYLLAFIKKFFSLSPENFLIFYTFLSFFITLICFYIVLKQFKLESYTPLALSYLFSTYYIVYFGNALRQILIIPLLLLSFYLFYKDKYILGFTIIFIASLFHFSAIWAITFIFVLKIFNAEKIKYYGIAIILIAIIFIFQEKLILNMIGYIIKHIPLDISSYIYKKINLYLTNKFALKDVSNILQIKNFIYFSFIYLIFMVIFNKDKESFVLFTKIFSTFVFITFLFLFNLPQIADRFLPYAFVSLSLIYLLSFKKNFYFFVFLTIINCIYFILVLNAPSTQYTLGFKF